MTQTAERAEVFARHVGSDSFGQLAPGTTLGEHKTASRMSGCPAERVQNPL